MKSLLTALLLILLGILPASADDHGKHLFILSGQSNMAGLNPDLSFTPTVENALGKDNVIVVKSAQGGQPIRRWYKDWKPANGEAPADKSKIGDLYDRLMAKVTEATKGQKIATVTFVWMQGERDAKEKHGAVYAASMRGLIDQVAADLKREKINFVIGRLSDFDMDNKRYPHWTMIRDAQVRVAEDDKRGAWVDTDDLNDKGTPERVKHDLHYTKDGYKTLGKRFADAAIGLIKK
ncbi:MAG: sialate O-acetylesterase [Phycisphaeraceae bacterium]|nr:sialate O-acetylesterase [Phycisphaeraceae bacterium]